MFYGGASSGAGERLYCHFGLQLFSGNPPAAGFSPVTRLSASSTALFQRKLT